MTEYERVKDTGDLIEVRRLKVQLEQARESLLEQLFVFRVPDAINPYHIALLTAGLGQSETRIRQDMVVDIRQEIQGQLAVYREVIDSDGQPILKAWVDDITQSKELIYLAVSKDRINIKERIKAGMIPIVMPCRRVQEQTWKVAMTNLKPLVIEGGRKRGISATYIGNVYELEYVKRTGFFNDIPDRPYLLWTKPTQGHGPDTVKKSFADQQAYYTTLVRDYPHLYDKTDLIPTEYSALQKIFTILVYERYQVLVGGKSEPVEIQPLDQEVCTRFLSMEEHLPGSFPHVYLNCWNMRFDFFHSDGEASGKHGFRPASRT